MEIQDHKADQVPVSAVDEESVQEWEVDRLG